MKKFFLMLIVPVLLTACGASLSANSSSPVRSPIAQIQLSSSQSTPAVQPAATDAPAVPAADPSSSAASAGTQTPVPNSSVVPAATVDAAMAPGLDVVSSQGYAMNNRFYIVGELLNNTPTPMGSINILATYYYQRVGKPIVVGTQNGSTLLDVIPAGGKAPFVIGPFQLQTNQGGPVTYYDLHETGRAGTLPRQDLVVQQGANSYSSGSWLYVRGEIQNTGTTDAKFVKAVVTLYNANGMIIGALSTYTNPSSVPAGGYAPFTASTEYWPSFDHFTVQVQGQ